MQIKTVIISKPKKCVSIVNTWSAIATYVLLVQLWKRTKNKRKKINRKSNRNKRI